MLTKSENLPAISVDGIGKRYRVGARPAYETLSEQLMQLPGRLAGRRREAATAESNEFWALDNVSLEIRSGETLGLIGRNGSGKSTLLKILSRITEPTTGEATIRGRVASLLEVGTGFHNELSGRENIYINGAILGMSRAEVNRAFDSIVAFSGIDAHLDTPIKRYSSGMRVRLAFAVAVHLQPEVLLLDEVLAVGDAEFQKRSFDRIQEVGQAGRTIVLVSHQMDVVQRLCRHTAWLERGKLMAVGPTADVISQYHAWIRQRAKGEERIDLTRRREGAGNLYVGGVAITDVNGLELPHVASGQDVRVEITYKVRDGYKPSHVTSRVGLYDQLDRQLFLVGNEFTGEEIEARASGGTIACTLPSLQLRPGQYYLNVDLRERGMLQDKIFQCCYFDVVPGKVDGFVNGLPPSGLVLHRSYWSRT